MLSVQRVLDQDSDISTVVNDYLTGPHVLSYTAGEYLYIGSEVPFNSLWFEVSSPNSGASGNLAVDIWWSNSWSSGVDVIDGTAASGISLKQSGLVRFSTNIDKGWDNEIRSSDVTGIDSSFQIYNKYWSRLKWPVNATASIRYIGQKFCSDEKLYTYYPGFNNSTLKTQFKSGKTDWGEQIVAASEAIIADLISRKVICSRGQIMDSERFAEACSHKTAAIIYGGLGNAYAESVIRANGEYRRCMNQDNFRIDANLSGNLEPSEARHSVSWGRR